MAQCAPPARRIKLPLAELVALGEAGQMGAGEHPDPEARLGEDRGHHHGGGSFPVGARDVQGPEVILRVA